MPSVFLQQCDESHLDLEWSWMFLGVMILVSFVIASLRVIPTWR